MGRLKILFDISSEIGQGLGFIKLVIAGCFVNVMGYYLFLLFFENVCMSVLAVGLLL